MTVPYLLSEKIKNKYFDICMQMNEYSYQGIFSILASTLKSICNSSHVCIYTYNEWRHNYTRIAHSSIEDSFPIQIKNGQELKILLPNNFDGTVLTMQSKNNWQVLIYIGWEEKSMFSAEHVEILRTETERMLTIIQSYHQEIREKEASAFLYDLSSTMLPMREKEEILRFIIGKLKNLYPNSRFNLLLSHDLHADSDLPVKYIEYSDDVTKMVSTQVFISGNVQVDNGQSGENSSLYVPLNGKQGVYGVLQVVLENEFQFPQHTIIFIKSIGEITGRAVENASLYEHTNQAVSDLKLINETTHKLNSNLQLPEITSHVKNLIMDVCHASQIGFIYYNETEEGIPFEVLTGSTDFFYTKQGYVFTKYLVDKNIKEAIFSGDFKEFASFPYRSLMVTPMINSNTVYGFIVVMHEEHAYFSFERFKLLQLLTQHATLALANTSLRNRLERSVITDHLTELFSRKHLEEEISNHMEVGEMGTLLLFDIDDFKKVNDTYGHQVGDQVLKQVAKVIKTFIETEDIPARWGGEELAIYAPNITSDEAVQTARVIRRQVENFTDPLVTLSCGVASWTVKEEDAVKRLFLRADKALYEAKKTGKNCVAQYMEI